MKGYINELGVSLVEVLIAMGLAAGLAVYLAQISSHQTKIAKTADFRSQANEIFYEISNVLKKNENACAYTLEGIFPGDKIPELKISPHPVNGVIAKKGEEFRKTGVVIQDMGLLAPTINGGLNNQGYIDTTTGKGTFLLRLKLMKKSNTAKVYGSEVLTKDIPIIATFRKRVTRSAFFFGKVNEADLATYCAQAPAAGTFEPNSITWEKNSDRTPKYTMFSQGFGLLYAVFECMWVDKVITNNELDSCDIGT